MPPPCSRQGYVLLALFAGVVALCFAGAGLFMFAPPSWSRTTVILVWTGFGVALASIATAALWLTVRSDREWLQQHLSPRAQKEDVGEIWLQ
jgi:membrane protein implicated in regulation of membrane protease activity